MSAYYEVEFEEGTNQVQNYAGDIGINIPIKSVNYQGNHAEIIMPRVKVYKRQKFAMMMPVVVIIFWKVCGLITAIILALSLAYEIYNRRRVGFFMMARSSICKKRLSMVNSVGVIDRGYDGELRASVFSTDGNPVKPLDETPLFQVVIGGDTTLYCAKNVVIDKERGEAGFGSSDTANTDVVNTNVDIADTDIADTDIADTDVSNTDIADVESEDSGSEDSTDCAANHWKEDLGGPF